MDEKTAMGTQGPSETAARTILVVDDDPGCSRQLAELLQCQGYHAVALRSGQEALEFVNTQGPPGLILLDLIMPQMGGLEVLSKIHERYPQVPICMVTALYDERVLNTAFRLGAYECIPKPMDFEQLRTAVLIKMFDRRDRGHTVTG